MHDVGLQCGLIAEEVAAVNLDLVVCDENGEIYTVRYDAVNAMLLNEFLKEHRKNEEQGATIADLKQELQATAAHQQKQIEALTAGLQKLSAQLEATKPAPQVVNNPQSHARPNKAAHQSLKSAAYSCVSATPTAPSTELANATASPGCAPVIAASMEICRQEKVICGAKEGVGQWHGCGLARAQ